MTDIRKGKGGEDSFDAEYDFSSMDWGGDGDADAKKDSPASADPFADDGFASFSGGGSTPSFGDEEGEDFEFDSIPAPGASGVPGIGNASDEFADIGGQEAGGGFDDEDEGDVFSSQPAPVKGGARSASAFEEDEDERSGDVFGQDDAEDAETDADASYGQGEADDGFDQTAGQEAEAPAPQSKPLLSRLMVPAALAVAGVAAYVGFGAFFPSSPEQPGTPPAVVASNDAPRAGSVEFPQGLPGSKPGPVAVPMDSRLPTTPPASETRGGAPVLSIPDLPRTSPTSPARTPIQVPEDDLVGGRRDGIQPQIGSPALPQSPVERAPSGFEDVDRQIGELRRVLDGVQSEMADLKARIAALQSRSGVPSASAVPSATVRSAGLSSDVVPPLKPAIIEGVSLKGVSVKPGARDMAWVSTKSGVVEVSEGDEVPEAGRVVKLRPYSGDWILVTSKGIVTR